MQPAPFVDKQSLQHLPNEPRMMGNADMALITNILEKLPKDAALIEFGPWLGGVSQRLARHGVLHVVDHFIWSDLNAAAYPNIRQPGESFRSVFEEIMTRAGAKATVHDVDFAAFQWEGPKLDFCLMDGPRDLAPLWHCLEEIKDSLKPDSFILIKHGVNPAQLDLMCWVGRLLSDGVVRLVETGQPRWCNIAVLQPGPHWGELSKYFQDETTEARALTAIADPWGGALFAFAQMARRLRDGRVSAAFEDLAQLPVDTAHIAAWDQMELAIDLPPDAQLSAAVFAEILAFQNASATPRLARGVDASVTWAMRGFWANQFQRGATDRVFEPNLIAQAFAAGAMEVPAMLGTDANDLRIVEFGRNLGLSGVGYLAAGAARYTGFEMGALSPMAADVTSAFAAIAYYSALTPPDNLSAADLIILRDGVQDHSQCKALLARMAEAEAEGPTPEILAVTNDKMAALQSHRANYWKRDRTT